MCCDYPNWEVKPVSWERKANVSGPAENVSMWTIWQALKVKVKVAQSCLTLFDPVVCSPPGSSVHGFSRQEYCAIVTYSVTQSCPTLFNPTDCSTAGFHVLHYLPEFAQTHVHWVGDAIQPSHPLSPSFSCPQSFPASGSFPMTQLFTSGGQSIGVSTSVLLMNIQDHLISSSVPDMLLPIFDPLPWFWRRSGKREAISRALKIRYP